MSLVNDVLRDLDARQGDGAEVAGVSGVAVTAGAPQGKSRRLLFLAVLVLAAIGLAIWLASTKPQPSEVVATHAAPIQATQSAPPQANAVAGAAASSLPNAPALDTTSLGINSSLTLIQAKPENSAAEPSVPADQQPTSSPPAAKVLTSRVSFGTAPPLGTVTVPTPVEPVIAARAESASSSPSQASTAAPAQASTATSSAREQDARLLIADGNYTAAIAVLTAEPMPAVAANTRYFALLAAAQTSARQPASAALTYRALLGVDARNGAWWLGYGAALEASQQPAAARDALQRALASRNLPPNLRQQAAMRLQRLEQNMGPTS